MTDIETLVNRSLTEESAEAFLDRVTEQADQLAAWMADGEFDNENFTVGMEMEVYAVSPSGGDTGGRTPRLTRLSDAVFESGATKELGLHNAEVNTDPDVLGERGLRAQAETLRGDFERAREAAREEGCDLVLDAMWTIPPEEGTDVYLGNVERRDGVTIAANMRPDPRYVALDNQALAYADGDLTLSVPGATHEFPTILFESLATSIQPHLQVPAVEDLPAYYNAGIRTLGPVLALSSNSPFLPADLYSDVDDARAVVDETHHELRIAAFEQSMNQRPNEKVRVPADIETTEQSLEHVVEDDLYAPFLREWIADGPRESLADELWEFQYKRGSFWRWLRCVVGGDGVEDACDERSVRIEYRPIPTQPTIQDVVSVQVLTVGLLRGLVGTDHPITSLSWADARDSFYRAAEDGLEADLAWVDETGRKTTETATIVDEVFEYARRGLADAGLSETAIGDYLDPIEARWEAGTTPSHWKKARVRDGLADGLPLSDAIVEMQREYIDLSRETDSFEKWL